MNQTVTIQGPERAIKAGTWAEKNIHNKWKMDIDSSPFSNRYNFVFTNSIDASYFALRWLQ